jgi:hypothetical protein
MKVIPAISPRQRSRFVVIGSLPADWRGCANWHKTGCYIGSCRGENPYFFYGCNQPTKKPDEFIRIISKFSIINWSLIT